MTDKEFQDLENKYMRARTVWQQTPYIEAALKVVDSMRAVELRYTAQDRTTFVQLPEGLNEQIKTLLAAALTRNEEILRDVNS